MFSQFFELLLERSKLILPLSAVVYLFAVLLTQAFHRLIHGQMTPGKNSAAIPRTTSPTGNCAVASIAKYSIATRDRLPPGVIIFYLY